RHGFARDHDHRARPARTLPRARRGLTRRPMSALMRPAMDPPRTLKRCARGHIMKPQWVECEICGVKVDRTPRAMDMNLPPMGPTMVSLSTGVPTREMPPPKAPLTALKGVLILPERDEVHKLRAGDNAVGASETN